MAEMLDITFQFRGHYTGDVVQSNSHSDSSHIEAFQQNIKNFNIASGCYFETLQKQQKILMAFHLFKLIRLCGFKCGKFSSKVYLCSFDMKSNLLAGNPTAVEYIQLAVQ